MKMYSNWWYGFWGIFLSAYMRMYLKLRYRFTHPLPEGPRIFAVNHPTVWDAFPLLIHRATRYLSVMVEEQIWSFPLPRFIFSTANQIKLFNIDKSRVEESIHDALQILNMGRSVLISPEGGRTSPDEDVRGKKGVIRLALEANVPIVPVGVWIPQDKVKQQRVNYNYQGRKYFDIAPIPRFRAPYGVVFGEPLSIKDSFTDTSSFNECQSLADKLLQRIYKLSEEAKKMFPEYRKK
ncbi:MAG: 1-acyl-sn-glycerol-3-phosphate acyltransferase [Spirochaetales bacterium]|nr:1-acyl-sn-glycerol-3-phosphate acyltransferase [Spirochaetales bacterium]